MKWLWTKAAHERSWQDTLHIFLYTLAECSFQKSYAYRYSVSYQHFVDGLWVVISNDRGADNFPNISTDHSGQLYQVYIAKEKYSIGTYSQ